MSLSKEEAVPLLQQFTRLDHEAISASKVVYRWIAKKASLILAVICVFLLFVSLSLSNEKKIKDSNICMKPACIHASSEILHSLSPDYRNIDPCTKFEELVCGGWRDRHGLRIDQGDAFTGTIMSDNSETILKNILEAPFQKDSKLSDFPTFDSLPHQNLTSKEAYMSIDGENFQKIKNAYDACIDESTIKKQGVRPLMKLVHQITGLFPVNESAILEGARLDTADEIKLSETLIFLEKLGVAGLISLSSGSDDKDPDVVVVKLSPPKRIGLPVKDYYENIQILQKYTNMLTQIFEKLNLTHWQNTQVNTTQWVHEENHISKLSVPTYLAEEVVNFEEKLSLASPNVSDSNDVTVYYNKYSLEDAENLTPQLRLSKVLKSLTPPDHTTQNLIVASPKYMESLRIILHESPKAVIQAYFIWKVIQISAFAVEAEEIKSYSRFLNELQGKDPESTPDRHRLCIGHVDDALSWILSRFYVGKAFSESSRHIGDKIITEIKSTFIEKLQESSWVDLGVVKSAIKKVQKIVQKIGYPSKSPNILDPLELKEFYSTLTISPTDFFENYLSSQRFRVARNWAKLGRPVDRDEWSMTVPTVNAYYDVRSNEIVFPAGIMQFPVFNSELPSYLNYGAFGAISGHEITHAFDSTGRRYDENGRYTDWWSNTTVAKFEERAQCFVNQYSNFTITDLTGKLLHVNGKLTLSENIADAGGVIVSFSAWKKNQATITDQNLPGLEHFSHDQLFFVSFANWLCGKSRKETAVSRIYTDPHSPMWARILGTIANSRDFKESFNCKVKDPVCELW